MNKKVVKFASLMIVTLLSLFILNLNVFAHQEESVQVNQRIDTQNTQNAEVVDQISQTNPTKVEGSRTVISLTRSILGLLQLIGVAVALVMLVVIGIKLILNLDKKADLKTIIVNFVFGCCCIFGATSIILFIQSIVAQIKFA